MSRKTRKLIWSAPLVAVLAVAGALAMFVMLAPENAQAHDPGTGIAPHGPPGPVTKLVATVASGTDDNGQPAGRTQIDLTWMAPKADMGGSADSYRIDYSDNTRVWRNLLGGESGEDALMDAMADSKCGSDAMEGMRCYTDTSLKPGQLRHYRVFAMNYSGTSVVSIEPTYATATTRDYGRPSAARGLTATTTLPDSIVLDWQSPTDFGGATLLWYCIAVGTSESTVPDLTDATEDANLTGCVNATEATAGDVAAGVARIVVPGDTTTYTQAELKTPGMISQYYRVYAVTDRDGMANTANDATASPAITNERYISLAASNTANGRTVSPLPSVDTDVEITPDPITNLRYVASRADGGADVTVNLYWTLPANYPAAPVGTVDADNPDLRARWRIEVQRYNPAGGDNNAGDFEAVTAAATPTSPAQWTSADTTNTNTLNDAEQLFRVLYVNNVDGTDDDGSATDNDVKGIPQQFRLPKTTPQRYEAQDLPRIAPTNYAADPQTGLRFKHNEKHPTTWLDLVWSADTPTDTANNHTPSGFAIDYTEATAIDQHTMWKSLPNARRPSDLGSTTQYTHKGVIPGKQYTYRVFPEHGTHNLARYGYRYGLPAVEEAASRKADLPDPVQGLMVVPDMDKPQTALKLTWSKLPDDRNGHPVQGYLVEVANDRDNDKNLDTAAAGFDWLSLAIRDNADTAGIDEAKPWTVDKDTLMYVYDGSKLETPETLAGGYVRWFRVIAITAENDADTGTGGSARNPADGAEINPPSPGETSPNASDELTAQPKDGMTAAPEAPPEASQPMSPPSPEDLTVEQASDTNLLNPTDRGVLLLWNEPESSSSLNAYLIQRKIGTGNWTPIGRVAARTSFTDSREYVEGEDLQYRIGSLGASSVPAAYADPVVYPSHRAMHMPGMTKMVEAMADSATEVTVSWMAPDNGGSAITGYQVRWKQSDAMDYATADMATAAPNASMHKVTGLMANTSYDFQVRANNAAGMGMWSMVAMTTTTIDMLTAPTNVMATLAADDPGQIVVTWNEGTGPTGYKHAVALFTRDFSRILTSTIDNDATGGRHVIEAGTLGIAAGEYVAVVATYHPSDLNTGMSLESNVITISDN